MVQRWEQDTQNHGPLMDRSDNGQYVTYADHARIVAEEVAAAEQRIRSDAGVIQAAHDIGQRGYDEGYERGKAEAEARWVEIARQDRMAAHQRGAQEAERQHAKALAEMEQAHAAALAAATRESAAHHYRMGKARGADLALNHDVGDEVMSDISAPKMSANDAIGDILRFNIDSGPAAPRTLTADDRPDYKWDQEEVDDLRRQGYERGLADARAAVDAVGRWRSFPDDTLLSRAAVLAAIDALIHDGEDR